MVCGECALAQEGYCGRRAVTLRCRAWTCPDCRSRRKRQLIALALSGKPDTFVTLTVNPKFGTSPYDRARRLADAWRVVVRLYKTKNKGKKLPYLCVFEATEQGEPHLHILCRSEWIHKRWLSDIMKKLMAAPVVDVQRVHNEKKLAWYVAKYIGKDPQRFQTCKRYWSTQDWELEKFEPQKPAGNWPHGWRIVRVPLAQLAEEWRAEGLQVEETRSSLLVRNKGPTPSELEAYENILELRAAGLPW